MLHSRALCVLCVVGCALALPLSQDPEPHHRMPGIVEAPGMDAEHPFVDQMDDIADCDGELGAQAKDVEIWPSPDPLPVPSPVVLTPRTNVTDLNATVPQPPQPAAPQPQCSDDTNFMDSNGLNCRDYTMNKELCKIADRYINKLGKSARHACCRCGGGSHVLPTIERKCVRAPMGGEAGCVEERYATLEESNKSKEGAVMGEGLLPPEDSILPGSVSSPAAGNHSLEHVVIEDELEDNVIDRLGTVDSMDAVLEPDSIVFRDRNFIGYPREPTDVQTKPSGDFAAKGTIKLSVPLTENFISARGPAILSALAHSAGVDPHNVALLSVKPSVIISFRVSPELDQTYDAASRIASQLNAAFQDNEFLANLFATGFPHCNLTVVNEVEVEEVLIPADVSLGYASTYKQYTTKTYSVLDSETLASIADKFHMSPALLVSFNEDVADPTMLKAGDILFIPVPRVLEITHVSATESPLEGGSEVVIKGSGFVYPAHCKFGDHITRATYVVEDTVVCVTPEQREPGFYSLSVTDGKGGFHDSSSMIHYTVGMIPFCDEPGARPSWCRPRLAIFTVSPLRIPQDTPATLHIVGAGFNASTTCFVNGEVAHTSVTSRSTLTCELSSRGPGINHVSLTQGSMSATSQHEIVVFSTLTVTKIFPEHGPEAGGSLVTLTGTTFKPGAMCRFNDMLVPAVLLSDSSLQCVAPANEAKVVNVDVTNDGHVFTPNSVHFEYTFLRLTNISIHEGHVQGGETMILTGYGFYPGAWCRFGTNKTAADYISLTTIKCVVPPQSEAKTVPVSVSLDGLRGWTEDEHFYEYFGDVTEVRPTEGRAIGGDDIHVFGNGFDQFCAYMCRFGAVTVPAVVISPSHLHCTSPPGSGVVEFTLESKDHRYKQNVMGAELKFTYHGAQDVDVFEVFPDHTDVRTANTSVVVTGTGFVPGMLCRFGDKTSLAKFVDAKTIKCDAPAKDLAEVVAVTVSHDGGRTWSGVLAYFEYRAVVLSIDPPMGHVQGGNTVKVTGYGFNYQISLCVFGNRVVRANVSNQYEATCVVPASEGPAKVPFALTCNASAMYDPYLEFQFKRPQADVWGTWYLYSLKPGFNVRSIEPAEGSTSGGNTITVNGEGFDQTVHCVFGDSTVKAVFLDAATATCVVPPHVPGEVEFSMVLFNRTEGYNKTILQSKYIYHPPELQSMSVESGFVTGGDVVRIYGSFLGGAITCTFGKHSSPVQQVTDQYVQCATPPADVASTVPVVLGYGIAGTSVGDLYFTYQPVVSSMSPQNGFIITDKQSVTFHGRGFNGEPVKCVFDGADQPVPATIRSDSEIECVVPSSLVPHATQVWLSNDKLSLVLGGQRFTYKYNPLLQDFHPNVGSTTGGTNVVLLGSGLTTSTHCAFDTQRVAATVVSDIMVRCVAPDHMPGEVSVSVIADTGNETTSFASSSVQFTYKIMNTMVSSIHPTAGSIGGGTLVTVRGSGFSMGSFCRFGEAEVPVIFYATDYVACYSPQVESGRTVTVEVSQIGGGEGFSSDGHTFTFNANISTVSRLEPSWGDEGDEIILVGSNFQEKSKCFFGGRASKETTFVSETQLKCTVPAMGAKPEEIVQVALDTAHLPGGSVIFHFNQPLADADSVAVREVIPSSGPSAGGTVVSVYGINFPAQALCRFGDLFVAATVVSPKQLQCISPQHRAATTVLEVVARDRSAFSSSFVRFTFVSTGTTETDLVDGAATGEPSLESVTPTSGKGGDTVTLVGYNFSSVGYCVFTDSTSTLQSRATVVDSSHVTCSVPDRLPSMGKAVTVKYLSVGGSSSQALSFSYLA